MQNKSIAHVREQLQQINEELLGMITGRRRFTSEKEYIHDGRDLHRRIGLCVSALKEMEENQRP